MELQKDYQTIKDRRHAAYSYKYHLIDLLRMSKFTFLETRAQKWENYKYTFSKKKFLPSERIIYRYSLDIYCALYYYADD